MSKLLSKLKAVGTWLGKRKKAVGALLGGISAPGIAAALSWFGIADLTPEQVTALAVGLSTLATWLAPKNTPATG